MSKIVIIGNGFDLAHNLKTKYKDFILWYLNSTIKVFIEKNEVSDDLLSLTSYTKITNLSNRYNEFTKISDFYDFLDNLFIEINYNHFFFENLLKKTIESNWVDIEYEYYSLVLKIYKQHENTKTYRLSTRDDKIKQLNNCFNAIKEKLIEYLLTIEKKEKETKNCIEELFKKEFNNLQPNEEIIFLNFNYTSTVESYLNLINKNNPTQLIYIHGKLEDSANPIIFGYGDEMDSYYSKIEDLNSNEFLRNFKSFGYFKTDNYQKLLAPLDFEKFDVYIMGHSCGISDRVLLNTIFEHNNCNSIKIFFHERSENENDFIEKTQEISRHFKPESKGKMRKRIIPFSQSIPLCK